MNKRCEDNEKTDKKYILLYPIIKKPTYIRS